ncbi:hypothetical protein PPYR_07495 [Photinus pyralis]|uniref:LRRCT domain-containing protein n=1 Tax=Photinus pyralis TaxID=7054 RepID=A0A5N4AQH8_PHOPY|nr:protein slit-like [Photinus pyralis]XP_031339086.1 protein slit-like [Photinus pyralis]KAB0799615.1 hypothetical protein PPYR_07495 [Photinus pyralis]
MVTSHGCVMLLAVSMHLVLLLGSATSSQCAYKCTCNETTIKCSEKQLRTIPDFKRVDLQPDTIDLSNNNIEEVNEYSFVNPKLQKVKYLELCDNKIFNVNRLAFTILTDLEYLDLSNNQLDEIPSEVVEKNTKLLELNLSNNLFGLNTPTIVSASVMVLDLSSCKLETFTEDNLKVTPKLQALYMHVNNFHHLDYHVFRHSSLKFLDVSYNPWKCHCDTIKFFEHLIKFGLTRLQRNVQCLHSNKLFEDIYGPNGPLANNFCSKKLHFTNHEPASQKVATKNDVEPAENNEVSKSPTGTYPESIANLVMHFEVIVITGIASVIIVVSLITLAVVVRRTHPVPHTVYREVPTAATFL